MKKVIVAFVFTFLFIMNLQASIDAGYYDKLIILYKNNQNSFNILDAMISEDHVKCISIPSGFDATNGLTQDRFNEYSKVMIKLDMDLICGDRDAPLFATIYENKTGKFVGDSFGFVYFPPNVAHELDSLDSIGMVDDYSLVMVDDHWGIYSEHYDFSVLEQTEKVDHKD